MTSTPLHVALYSHNTKGLGHLRRSLALAYHLARTLPGLTGRDVTGLVITGLTPGQEYRLPDGFDWLVLPGTKKSGGIYQSQHLHITYEDLDEVHSALLNGILSIFAPGLLIIDRHAYGVHQELHELLTHLRRTYPSTRIMPGLREVLDTPATVQREWGELGEADTLRRLIDEVWVYGDAVVHDLNVTGEAPPALGGRMYYTGYLAHGRDIAEPRDDSEASSTLAGNALGPEPFILTTIDSGCDSIRLLRTATQVRAPDGYQHVVVTGPQPDAALFHQVVQAAGPRTVVRRSWPGMNRHIQQATAVIAMAGYSMVTEVFASGTPTLLILRETSRLEQFIRTSGLKKAGAVDLLRITGLSATVLEDRLSELLGDQEASHRQLMRRCRLHLSGLATVPLLTAEFMDHRHDIPATSPTYLISHAISLTRMGVPA